MNLSYLNPCHCCPLQYKRCQFPKATLCIPVSNIGNPISANKLAEMFGIKSSSTLLDYFSYLQDAYLLEFIPLFDYSLKKQVQNSKKVCAIDLGIYQQNSTSFPDNTGHIIRLMI